MVTHLLAAVMATGLSVGDAPVSLSNSSLEDAGRAYRMAVYETFHTDRTEFDRRRAEWRRIEQEWLAAGKPEREVPALLQWLTKATTRSQGDSISPLPEAPKIAADLKADKDQAAFWRMLLPHAPEPETPATAPVAKSVTEKSAVTTDVKTSVPPAAGEASKATPVSSRNTFDNPALEEKKPDETAPVSPITVPDPAGKDDSAARPDAPADADAAAWFHELGKDLGEDLNYLGLTLAWKREAKR